MITAAPLQRHQWEIVAGGRGVLPSFLLSASDIDASATPDEMPERLGKTAGLMSLGAGTTPDYAQSMSTVRGSAALAATMKGVGGALFTAADTAIGNFTGDAVFLLVGTISGNTNARAIGKGTWGTNKSWGWYTQTSDGGVVGFAINSSGAYAITKKVSIGGAGTEFIAVTCLDIDEASANGGMLYVGAARGTGANFATVAPVTNSLALTWGAESGGLYPSNGKIALAGMWQQPEWFPGGAANLDIFDKIAAGLTSRVAA